MKQTHVWLLVAFVVLCALGVRWRMSPARFDPAPAVSEAVASTPVASPAPEVAAAATPQLEGERPPDPRQSLDVSSYPVLEDRARQQELAPAADARWQQAVDEAGYSANDLDESVRELFRRIDLDPRYADDGHIDGLLITGMAPDHPFAQLGFRPGDRIDRIQGVALRDPAEIPSLLARLGPNFELCVDRQGAELCGQVELE